MDLQVIILGKSKYNLHRIWVETQLGQRKHYKQLEHRLNSPVNSSESIKLDLVLSPSRPYSGLFSLDDGASVKDEGMQKQT